MVSLCWLHQDWFIWPLLAEFDDQKNFLAWLYVQEHELKMGIPAGLGYQVALSFAIAAGWWLAVWKAWPTELEEWAEGHSNRRRGRGRRGGRGERSGRDDRESSQRKSDDRRGGDNRRRRSRGRRGGGRDSSGSSSSARSTS